jgi:hypothetical protein
MPPGIGRAAREAGDGLLEDPLAKREARVPQPAGFLAGDPTPARRQAGLVLGQPGLKVLGRADEVAHGRVVKHALDDVVCRQPREERERPQGRGEVERVRLHQVEQRLDECRDVVGGRILEAKALRERDGKLAVALSRKEADHL